MHGLLWYVVIGLVSGWLAGKIMHGGGFGVAGDIVLGIVGAVVGGWLFDQLGISVGGLTGSVLTATVGALVLLFGIRLLRGA